MMSLLLMDGVTPPFPHEGFTAEQFLALALGVCGVVSIGCLVVVETQRLWRKWRDI